MNRRTSLAIVGGMVIGATAGCLNSITGGSGGQDSDGDGVIDSEDYAPNDSEVQKRSDLTGGTTPPPQTTTRQTETETPPSTTTTTSTRTTTATTTSPDPTVTVTAINHVYEWEEFGDATDNVLTASAPGVPSVVAFRYRAPLHKGRPNVTKQMEIFDPNDQRILIKDAPYKQVAEGDETTWEHSFLFQTVDWETGTYEAEITVRDPTIEEGDSVATTFQLTDPLDADAVTVETIDAPRRIQTGEPYQIRLVFSNTGGVDGGFISPLSVRVPGGRWRTGEAPIALGIPSNGTNDWESGTVRFSEPREIQYRVDKLNRVWSVEVTD